MDTRAAVTAAILPVLREFFPAAGEKDLLFHGGEDVASPLPRKYGLDSADGIVYNLMNRVKFRGVPLFSAVRIEDGFIDMTFGPEAMVLIAEDAAQSAAVPAESYELGANPMCLCAMLMTAAATAKAEDPFVPEGLARRAVLHTVFASSDPALAIALRETAAALSAHRRAKPGSPERLGCLTASAMAGALTEWF